MCNGHSRRLPSTPEGYELVEQIGSGTGPGGAVYRAMCHEIDDEVAIRIIDLDQLQASLEDISRDINVMSLSSHPNVVPFSTCFLARSDLWVVMPLLSGGSVSSLIECHYRDGLPPRTAIYVLHCALKALDYFHANGQIHRDVRAANVMLDARGQAMLSDYGMMGWMVESGWERKHRQTFVGTPCWMAPEVMEQTKGYDYKADVWSLGITAIELAMGSAPYVNYPPMKVLIMTLQNPPPTLSGRAAEEYPESYKDFIRVCLEKDPDARPTAKQLLDHPLFSSVEKPEDLESVLASLPPVGSRGGFAQKMLYRQMKKAMSASSSGVLDALSPDMRWDFKDPVADAEKARGVVPRATDAGLAVVDEEPRVPSALPYTPGSAPSHRTPGAFGGENAFDPSRASTSSVTRLGDAVIVSSDVPAASFPQHDQADMSSTAMTAASSRASSSGMLPSATPSLTPGTTPSVTPANMVATPAVSPPSENETASSFLPPSAGVSENTSSSAQVRVLPAAAPAHSQAPPNGNSHTAVPSGKSGGLQKKGRFTVQDVEVSAEKLNAKLNVFIDDEFDLSTTGSHPTSNGAGGAISNSSSFTSLPTPTETSPTAAVQPAAPVAVRQPLPSGMDSSVLGVGQGVPVSGSTSINAVKSTKGRFEVSSVGVASSGGPATTISTGADASVPKASERIVTIDGSESAENIGNMSVEKMSPKNEELRSAPSSVPPATHTDPLPSMQSKESLPTLPSPLSGAAHSQVAGQPSVLRREGSGAVSALTSCVRTLTTECERLAHENEQLKHELAHARATLVAESNSHQLQLMRQEVNVIRQQSQDEKLLIQQLQLQVQMLQRQQDPSVHGATRQGSQEPAQVKVLTQLTARPQSQPSALQSVSSLPVAAPQQHTSLRPQGYSSVPVASQSQPPYQGHSSAALTTHGTPGVVTQGSSKYASQPHASQPRLHHPSAQPGHYVPPTTAQQSSPGMRQPGVVRSKTSRQGHGSDARQTQPGNLQSQVQTLPQPQLSTQVQPGASSMPYLTKVAVEHHGAGHPQHMVSSMPPNIVQHPVEARASLEDGHASGSVASHGAETVGAKVELSPLEAALSLGRVDGSERPSRELFQGQRVSVRSSSSQSNVPIGIAPRQQSEMSMERDPSSRILRGFQPDDREAMLPVVREEETELLAPLGNEASLDPVGFNGQR